MCRGWGDWLARLDDWSLGVALWVLMRGCCVDLLCVLQLHMTQVDASVVPTSKRTYASNLQLFVLIILVMLVGWVLF